MAVDMFLKIEGIDGESTQHKHKAEIELLSFSWGLTNKTSSSGGGGGAGKVQVSDFSIVKQMTSSSPALMEKCCSGEHIQWVQVSLVNREAQQEFYKIKLSDVLISSYQTGGNGGSAIPVEQVSFNFRQADVQAADKSGRFNQVSCDFQKAPQDVIGQHNH